MADSSDKVTHHKLSPAEISPPWVPFDQREEFADLKPVPQDDGPFPVCPIAYSPQFVNTLDYFRAIMQKDERSERALLVTTEVIHLNPANYTTWYYRRLVLVDLQKDLHKELEFTAEVAEEHPKNYQIWYHRRWLIEQLRDPSKELEFTAVILQDDAKNYHAWSHRQWVLKEFKLWDNEMKYVEELLALDVRNNSAWNQRYFVAFHTTGLTKEDREKEMAFAAEKIKKAPNNESAWNYLTGMVKGMKFSDFPFIEQFCDSNKSMWVTCPHVLGTLIDIYEESQTPDKIELAKQYCDKLASGVDDMHQKYWTWRKLQLQKQ